MEQISEMDMDYVVQKIKHEFNKKENNQEEDREKWNSRLGFTVNLPKGFIEESIEMTSLIYHSKKRPALLLRNREENVGITFQTIDMDSSQTLYSQRSQIKQVLKKADDRSVFYEEGELVDSFPIVWMDYKSFAFDERIYNILFLFKREETMVLGTCYCRFEDYDKWKQVMLQMLQTIRYTKEDANERI